MSFDEIKINKIYKSKKEEEEKIILIIIIAICHKCVVKIIKKIFQKKGYFMYQK